MGKATPTKTFDCVEMKNRIQARRRADYEAHKDEYASYLDFVRDRARASEWVRQMRDQSAGKE